MFDLTGITDITPSRPLRDLSSEELALIQRGLGANCYDAGPVDGLIGPKTRTAYSDLIEDLDLDDETVVEGAACTHLNDRARELREILAAPLDTEDDVKAGIARMCRFAGLGMPEQIAYVTATAKWETNHKFKPVREAYWVDDAENWRRENLRYYPFYGRGYVQLTWERNYKQYSGLFGRDMVADPDLALRHDISLFVLVQGMKLGAFTGRKLEDYVRPGHVDFIKARKVINGTDKAREIADIAEGFV